MVTAQARVLAPQKLGSHFLHFAVFHDVFDSSPFHAVRHKTRQPNDEVHGISDRNQPQSLPQNIVANPVLSFVTHRVAHQLSGGFRSMYFPGLTAVVKGEVPLLDAEIPAANGVATARGLARMYGAIANGGEIDGTRFLSRELVAGLTGRRSLRPDRNIYVPLAFHLGYHRLPIGNVMPGFGHVGLGGSVGWTDPATGVAFALVHNRLLTPFVATDHAAFVGLYALIRRAAAQVRKRGFRPVTEFGSPFAEPGAVAG